MGTCSCSECTQEEAFIYYDRYYNPLTKRTSHNVMLQPEKNQEKLQTKMQNNHEYMALFEPSRYVTVRKILEEKKGVPRCIINRIMELAEEDDRCEGCKFYKGTKLSYADEDPRTCAACKAENLTLIPERRAKRTFKSLTSLDFVTSPKYIVRTTNGRRTECYRVKDLEKLYNQPSGIRYKPRTRRTRVKKNLDLPSLSQKSHLTLSQGSQFSEEEEEREITLSQVPTLNFKNDEEEEEEASSSQLPAKRKMSPKKSKKRLKLSQGCLDEDSDAEIGELLSQDVVE